MLKKFAIFAAVVAVTTMVALSFITARFIDQEEILRVQNERQELIDRNAELNSKVDNLTAEQEALNADIDLRNAEIEQHKTTIAQLEKERRENQLKVRSLRTEDELENKFAKAFPAVTGARFFGITQIEDADEGITLPYYVIPAWFVSTFIEDNTNATTHLKEIEEYKANEALYGSVIDLKDKVLKLEAEKSAAWKEGYDDAFAKYLALNDEYVDLLKKPPTVEFKPPSLWSSLGGLVLGIAIGAGT